MALLSLSAWGSGNYLTRSGPPPLRFAPAIDPTRAFSWPTPLVLTNSATNSVDFSTNNTPFSSTNDTILSATSPAAQTNRTDNGGGLEAPGTQSVLGPFALGADTNILSASNLLNITPQMLADYFRATLESTIRSSTNAVNGAEVPFNPPTPKPVPSSEAIYRVQ